jgi:hypothetical protein
MKRNRKGQVGEVIEDFPAFIVIALILLIMIILTVALYAGEVKARQLKIDEKIILDRIRIMLNSLMQEKQVDGETFTDLVRNKDPRAQERLNKEMWAIYDDYNRKHGLVSNYGGNIKIYYSDALNECKKVDSFGKNICVFIPGNEMILIKSITFYSGL